MLTLFDVNRLVRESLAARCFDYDVEVYDGAPIATGKTIVLLIGDARAWAREGQSVLASLRRDETRWRPMGVCVEYRFMAVDAMAA
jgi:hypothetical protein